MNSAPQPSPLPRAEPGGEGAHAAPEATGTSLREATLSGVRWTSAGRLVAEVSAFGSSVVLARLVPPGEFGLTVVAMFVATLAQSVATQGVGSFLVHLEAPTRRHYQAAMSLCVVTGLAGTAFTAIFALTAAPPLFGERAAQLLLVASPVALLSSFAAVPMAELQRRLSFRRLAVIDAAMSFAAPFVAVVLAVAGLNGEAIILGMLASALIGVVLSWLSSPPVRPGWSSPELRQIAAYGAPATGSSILYTAVRNVDYVILAARLPAVQVGLYLRAFVLGSDHQAKISGILLRVALPVFSRSRDLEELRRVRARMVRAHAALIFPLLFALIAVAPTFVPWLYGEPWAAAGPMTQILAIGGMLAAVGTGTGPLLLAAGHPKALFSYNLVVFCTYSAAVLIAVPHGVIAVCWATVASRIVTFVVLQYVVVERRVGIPVLKTMRHDVIPAVTGGLALLAVTWLALHALSSTGAPTIVDLLASGLAGLAVYALVLRRFFTGAWDDVVLLFERLGLPAPSVAGALSRLGIGGRGA